MPASLRQVELEVLVAGQRHQQTFEPAPDQSYVFEWDGRDGYGRLIQGETEALIRVGYVYDGSYTSTSQFAMPGNAVITGSRTREQVTLWSERTVELVSVSVTTPLDRTRTFAQAAGEDGARVSASEGSDGVVHEEQATETSRVTHLRDGSTLEVSLGPDVCWQMQVPVARSTTLTVPSGRSLSTTRSQELVATDPRDPMSMTSLTESVTTPTTSWTRTYDAAERTLTSSVDGQSLSVVTFDEEGRVAEVAAAGGPALHRSYDDVGRLVERRWVGGSDERAFRHGYDSNGYVSTITLPDERAASLVHDVTGRVVSFAGPDGETTDLSYTPLNALSSVTPPGRGEHGQEYYDLVGRRISKSVGGVLTEGYLYLGILQPLAKLDAEGVIVAQFVYGQNADVPDVMLAGGSTYRLVRDQVGSVRLVVDVATGEVVQRMDYDEFGRVLVDTNPGFQPFGFAGGLYDPDTGFVRFGVRDYDARTGRWTSKDPTRFNGRQASLYTYVGNDPVNRVDSSGLQHQPGGPWHPPSGVGM